MMMTRKKPFSKVNRWKAFTLIEFIVCLGVIAVIAALISAATIRSKDQAFRASNLQRLKQLATATVLYADQYGDYPVRRPAAALLESGFLKNPDLLSSRFDPLPDGIWGSVVGQEKSDFKESDIRSFGYPRKLLSEVRERGSPYGLYADVSIGTLARNQVTQRGPLLFSGKYQRVNSDTSVVVRYQSLVPYIENTSCVATLFYFVDMKQRDMQEYCRTQRGL